MAELLIQTGKHQGKKLAIPAAGVVIGRDEKCRIRLASSDVSRQHCLLRETSGGIAVRDLGSSNGTLVNEVRIEEETVLRPGDTLRIGPMLFSVPVPKPEVAVKLARPANSDSASDDDIANWLANEDDTATGDVAAGGATTIITKFSGAQQKPRETAKRDFKSIAEEAAWIIQRHWEKTKQS